MSVSGKKPKFLREERHNVILKDRNWHAYLHSIWHPVSKTRAQQKLRWASVDTIDMGRKDGGLLCPFRAELGPRLIQCGLGRGLLPYQVASSSMQPFGHKINMGQKLGGGGCALCSGGSWVTIEHSRLGRGLPLYPLPS